MQQRLQKCISEAGVASRRAAETMGIHRNTLAYRMRRIEARFALNLGDMNTCFELLFSLWLRDGIGGEVQPESTESFDSGAVRAALWRFTERTGGAEAPCVLSWPSRQSAWETWATKSAWN